MDRKKNKELSKNNCICNICGKRFHIRPSLLNKGHGKFCSRKCLGVWHSKTLNKENAPGWKGGKLRKICKMCGKEYNVSPHRKSSSIFCSRICHSKSMEGKIFPELRKRINERCLVCGRDFWTHLSRHKTGAVKFCSYRCMGKWCSENRVGANSHRWKGGITPIIKRIRHSDRYIQWRQQIFIRDGFACQKCHETGGDLEVHHIKPFHKIIQEVGKLLPLFDLYNGAMIYAPLWGINNGTTLCKRCHNKTKRRTNHRRLPGGGGIV